MLRVMIKGIDAFDEAENKFVGYKDSIVDFEHSLISLSKWESKHFKPFLSSMSSKETTPEEMLDYLRCMMLDPNLDPDVLTRCSQENINEIQTYIESPQSATTFGKDPERRGPSEPITSELIYYWMVAFNIDFECQYWHLNRLLALVRICELKNAKPKKRSKRAIAEERRRLNDERRARLGTSG